MSGIKTNRGVEAAIDGAVIATMVTLALLWSVPAVAAVDDIRPVTASGTVSAADGRVLTELVVYLRHGPESAYKYTSTKVDAAGRFHFEKLKPGLIIVAAFAPGLSVAGQSRVMLQPGQTATNVDLALSAADSVSVFVVDTDGHPVAGAKLSQVMWRTHDSPAVWLPEPYLRRMTTAMPVSDASGRLTVPWIPRNAVFSVRVSHPDFANSETPVSSVTKVPSLLPLHRGKPLTVRVIDAATGRPARSSIVSVTDAALTPFQETERPVDDHGEYQMRIATGDRVVIHVTHPTLAPARHVLLWNEQPTTVDVSLYHKAVITGRVVDPDANPIENVRMDFSAAPGSSAFSSRAVTDRNGHYRIDAREGEGHVKAGSGRGYVCEEEPIPIRLQAGGTAELRDIVVHPIPAIRGMVVDSNGMPLPYALVSDQSLPFGGQQTQADRDGRFQLPLESVPRFMATLVVVRHPTSPNAGGLVVPYTDVRLGKEVRIAVQPESTLAGKVVTSDPGSQAAANVQVKAEMLVDMGKRKYLLPTATTVTDKTGRFEFKGLSRHTRYHVTTSRQGTRGIPEGLIELRHDIVELPELLQVEPSNAVAVEATTIQNPPPLACSDWINSSPLSLSELQGKVVLIDFWATWCSPCVRELPKLQLAHRLYADKGLVFIGVHDNSASEADVRSFIEQRNITFPIALDNAKGQTVGRYKVTRWPTKVLIDRHGNIVPLRENDDLLTVLRSKLLYETD